MPKLVNFRKVTGTRLHRSSQPNKATDADLQDFQNLGITAIVDMRKAVSVMPEDQKDQPVNTMYTPISVKSSKKTNEISYQPILSTPTQNATKCVGNHYSLDILGREYFLGVWMTAPLYVRFICYLIYMFDKYFKTEHVIYVMCRLWISRLGLCQQYIDSLRYGRAYVCEALKILSEPNNRTALVCCQIGKDRTGYICALVQSCCGVSSDQICKDYAKSEENWQPYKDRIVAGFRDMGCPPSFALAREETMRGVLNWMVQEFGSVSGYLESIGFTKEDQQRLRENVKLD